MKHLVLTGATADKRISAAVRECAEYRGEPSISQYEDFSAAVMAAHGMAQLGCGPFSPACLV